MNKNISEIKRLRETIIKHDKAYARHQPIITDSDYDELYMKLVELERLSDEPIPKDSPTQRIYTVLVDGLEEVEHKVKMLSQEKSKTEEDIRKFYERVIGLILAQQKLDGLTIVLTYKNGILIKAVTRGNGKIGEDVTHTIRTSDSLPKKINYKGELVVRAEAVLPLTEFERIIKTEDYMNARNLVAGTVRQLDASVANERNIDVIAFDLVSIDGIEFSKDTEQLEFLKELGFEVVEYEIFETFEELKEFCFSYNEKVRKKLNHLVDGLVLKTNDLLERKKIGSTRKHPKWSTAFKFESVEATTTIKDYVTQIGKTGIMTPVSIFKPTEVDGSLVTRATLNNMDFIRENDIRVGDTVIITKGGDIIPKVVKVLKEYRNENETTPIDITTCPDCGSLLEYKQKADGTRTSDLYCVNLDCPAQVLNKIIHFVGRNAMNIDGLGNEKITDLLENNLIDSIVDLYDLKNKEEQFVSIPGLGKKSFDNIVEELEKSKDRPLENVLYALAIPKVGENTSELVAKEFLSMKDMIGCFKEKTSESKDRVVKLEGLGDVAADSLEKYIFDNENMLNKLIDCGLTMETKIEEIAEIKGIVGKKFVVTGKLENFENRKEIKNHIKKFGGKPVGSVSSNTDYLINNDLKSKSSKNVKANKLGIPIITEEEYLEMAKN